MSNQIINVEARTADTIAIEIRTTVRNTQKIMLEAAISIGNDLIEAKELVDHGEWKNWLENSVGFSYESAKKYMQISREYGDFSKRELITDLSYTKALKLLAVSDEDREEFIENNNVEDMTVKELEEEIRKIKEEKGRTEKRLEEANTEKELIQQANSMLMDEKKELDQKIQELTEAAASENDEEAQRQIEEALNEQKKILADKEKELEKEQGKAEKLQKKIEKLEADRATEVERVKSEAAQAAKEEAAKENEESRNKLQEEVNLAREKLALTEKKLEQSSNEEITKFKILITDFQEMFNDIINTVDNIQLNDSEQADKCKAALGVVISSMEERCS